MDQPPRIQAKPLYAQMVALEARRTKLSKSCLNMLDRISKGPSACETDDSGKYVLEFSQGRKGAIPGMNRVEINTARLAYEKDGKMFPAVKESVPAKYNRLTTLEFNVEQGKNNIADFKLTSGGKIIEE